MTKRNRSCPSVCGLVHDITGRGGITDIHTVISWSMHMRDILAPLHDHKGRRTPSEASRAYFLLVMVMSVTVGYNAAKGNLLLGAACSLGIATMLLNVGWLILNTIGETRTSVALTGAVTRMNDMDEEE